MWCYLGTYNFKVKYNSLTLGAMFYSEKDFKSLKN